jgi:hypothetical protein
LVSFLFTKQKLGNIFYDRYFTVVEDELFQSMRSFAGGDGCGGDSLLEAVHVAPKNTLTLELHLKLNKRNMPGVVECIINRKGNLSESELWTWWTSG